MHCYEADKPAGQQISGATMKHAVALGCGFLDHARRLYGETGGDQAVDNAKFILQKVAGLWQISKRDLYRDCRSRFKTVKTMEPAVVLLCEHGYLKEIVKQPKGGHRPSIIYYVNPKAFT